MAIVIGTGLDGAGALSSIRRICTGYRFKEVQEALIIKAPVRDEDLAARALGTAMGFGLEAGIF